MRILKLVTILMVLQLFATSIYAQTSEEISVYTQNESIPIVTEDASRNAVSSINSYFELEIVRGSQSPFNKDIPYTLYVTPKINSSRTQITWEVPTTFEVRVLHREFVDLIKDQTYTFKADVSPKREGTYDIGVNIVSWQHDTNYTSSVSSTVSLNKNFVVQPVDSEYTVSIMLMLAGGVLFSIIGGFFVYKLSTKMIKKLKLWLTPPY